MPRHKKNLGFQWAYVGITGPFQILDDKGRVAATIQTGDDPNKMIPAVAKITKILERQAKEANPSTT